jgi:CheY-like chemotaxis protein
MDTGREIRILVVDDDLADLERTVEALRCRGLASGLRTARGGQEALDYLFGRGQFHARRYYPIPDLVLLDLNMPAIDGYAVLRCVRQAETLRRIPVIVLCMSEQEGGRAMAYEVRANSYLVKPVTFDSFTNLPQQLENWTLHLDLPPPTGYRSLRWPLYCQAGPASA